MTHLTMCSKYTIALAATLALFAGDAWTQESNLLQPQSVSAGSGEVNDTTRLTIRLSRCLQSMCRAALCLRRMDFPAEPLIRANCG